ncbi:uncharacterized protein BT62DRAFT_936536 [Guyanagaster necrorhizus]|uniref:Uncharacterized protein n=1 Tax=Guyanagaster necrorhizus TaxID=856835 RepID=A0A9P8ANJ2_9AGAR|nr:uncharacterized protein BT62DRAFT_936536 [Guyanagaster necrorhizus MCA 3950]KAG7441904.1 hypothetical protein BT62DRAFT_936536 [Guyanagaster necrorhizus MCA 3950]
MFSTSSISGHITLQSAGLIALADLSTVALRMALTGTASYLDILVLAPGMHQQQSAVKINDSELPDTASMTNGYIFRVENPATVNYLRHISRIGQLVTAHVSPKLPRGLNLFTNRFFKIDLSPHITPVFVTGIRATLLYLTCPILTIIVFALLVAIRDWWAFGVLGMLVLARFINVVVIKRRSKEGWKGKKELGVEGDLLILLSQDRWIRLQGLVDDLKAVTAGQWLRGETAEEEFAVGFATLLVYASAALAGNASTVGSLHIACLLLCSAGLLSLCNHSTWCLQMFGRVIRREGEPKDYDRRLDMVEDLICQTGKVDWAIAMGLIKPAEAVAAPEKSPSKYPDENPSVPVDGNASLDISQP